jgi:hypothetical protein
MGEDRGGGEKINSTPHPDPLPRSGEGRKGKDLTALLLLFSPARGEKKEDERKRMTLTAPLTFVLSCKGREESEKFSSRASSPLTGEDRGGGEKINSTPHPDPVL